MTICVHQVSRRTLQLVLFLPIGALNTWRILLIFYHHLATCNQATAKPQSINVDMPHSPHNPGAWCQQDSCLSIKEGRGIVPLVGLVSHRLICFFRRLGAPWTGIHPAGECHLRIVLHAHSTAPKIPVYHRYSPLAFRAANLAGAPACPAHYVSSLSFANVSARNSA